jgi:hypothetical protein
VVPEHVLAVVPEHVLAVVPEHVLAVVPEQVAHDGSLPVHDEVLPEHTCESEVAAVVVVEPEVFATAPTTPKSEHTTVATTKTAAIFPI